MKAKVGVANLVVSTVPPKNRILIFLGDGYDPCWGVRSSFFFTPLAMGTFIAGGTIFCGFFVICRGHLSGEGRYVSEYYKCHRYIKYSMMKSLPVVGIFIKEIMIFGNVSNVL